MAKRNRSRICPLTSHLSRLHIYISTTFLELGRLSLHLGGVLPHILSDLHRAELRAAHGAEVSHLGALCRERLVMVGTCGDGIERKVELILPPEVEPSLAERIIPGSSPRVPLRQVGGMRRDLVGDDAGL